MTTVRYYCMDIAMKALSQFCLIVSVLFPLLYWIRSVTLVILDCVFPVTSYLQHTGYPDFSVLLDSFCTVSLILHAR